jgi:hypothetical protein
MCFPTEHTIFFPTYDQIHRLKDMSRGELNDLKSQISNLEFSQCWGLDETGNWSNFRSRWGGVAAGASGGVAVGVASLP